MSTDNNRLLLELDRYRREINRDIINPRFPELRMEDLKPVLTMVAHARADFVSQLLELAESGSGEPPAPEQIATLKRSRETFEELVAAVNALESVISRDYLDVDSGSQSR
ncbi:hypothetical protein [Marinobacterium sediminicola]|uniref:Uncharacterized protein n=1 Tax=Marinobacterium sediminicola TaxID=518898 RepID=A0ABY1S0W0_9GAMM|nr:hypothetical protein [Marinobacterium sediminicola]ULG69618.1 hypothetical protein LN244_02030 [Marinobacterium sediminicola]SMR74654.1 hypothetical protein SAMN04487964_107118 [Marinobacterium sediminicola]